MYYINTLSWFSDKLESFGEWFKRIINKYIGTGLSAMFITLILIVIAIVVIKKFANR